MAAEQRAAEEAAAAAARAEEERLAAEAAARAEEERLAAEARAAEEAAAAAAAAEEAAAAAAGSDAAGRGAAEAAAAVAAAGEQPVEAPAATVPAEGLRPDTRVASPPPTPRRRISASGRPDAATCNSVDRPGTTGYVVITPISIRQDENLVVADAPALVDGTATVGGVEISMPSPESLVVAGTSMVRCSQ